MDKDIIIEAYKKYKSAYNMEKVLTACNKRSLTFGDARSIYARDLASTLSIILNEKSIQCEDCDNFFDIQHINLYDIDGDARIICEDCDNNYIICHTCGQVMYYESADIKDIDGEAYCLTCYLEKSEPYEAVCDKDNGVFKAPRTKRDIAGYSLVQEYFVDSSGFGADNEPALTSDNFLRKVKKGLYYGIVDCGQFQVYIGEFKKL